MRVSDGFGRIHGEKIAKGKVLRLNKSIYGLVQAARQWRGKFSEEIIKFGYKDNNVNEFCILCIHVDDGDHHLQGKDNEKQN
jgi:hypothetical protein